GLVDGAVGRGLGLLAELGSRRVLAFGQAVDADVEEQDLEVDVAAEREEEVVATDGERVAVARHHPHLQVGPRILQSGGDGRRATVNGVETVCIHVIGGSARAADPRDEDDGLAGAAQLGQHLLHRGENGVVAAPRAAAALLVRLEILAREPNDGGRFHESSSSMRSTSSVTWKGLPWTLLIPFASTRYRLRRMVRSWPMFSSGTTTRSKRERISPRSRGSGLR